VPDPPPSAPGLSGRLGQLYGTWLPIAFVVAALANLVLTFYLPRPALPIRGNADSSLTYLVHHAQPSVDRRFAFYLELDDATDGGELVVPVDSGVAPELVDGFAEMEVVERDYDPVGLLPDDLVVGPPLGELETEEADLLYWIVEGDSDLWWLAATDEGIVIVPETVAPAPGDGS
jgi:hypothetical protein